MSTEAPHPDRLRVVVAGGGVAALETAFALAHLAGERTAVTLIAPNAEFVYRPLAVREPFAYGRARRYPLGRVAADAGARLLVDELDRVEPDKHMLHTAAGQMVEYDALVLALGARARARYRHALTIDDRRLDELMRGLIQDVEGGYVHSLAFVAPGPIAWPLPLYELALMTAARAYDMGVEPTITIITPEASPLAIFGRAVSDAVAQLLAAARMRTIGSAYAEIPSVGEVVVDPGDRRLHVDRVIALPELYGPEVRGVPLGEHGFLPVDSHQRVTGVEHVYAVGDAADFPVKHGGLASQQADAAAQAIAALAGAAVTPEPFHPVIRAILLTGDRPRYLTAHIDGERVSSSEIADAPTWSPPSKVASAYLAPYLAALDRDDDTARSRPTVVSS